MGSPRTIAITMGDPGGIGPEVIVKALYSPEIRDYCRPLVVGNIDVLKEAVRLCGLPLAMRSINTISGSIPDPGIVEVFDSLPGAAFEKGVPSERAGRAFVEYIKKAVDLAQAKNVDAVVTAPISKESMKMAGYSWPGHTELLARLTNTENFAMMFISDKLRIILCTIHIPLKDVPNALRGRLVLNTIELAGMGTKMLGIKDPRIAVAGLNPHAGESGIMGQEESTTIEPAVERAQKRGINVSGPYPPDVVFHKTYNGEFDIIVCMYHDQGLIPFKMVAFDKGVNVTVGLPIVRTSPDHGTGFDIAWKNRADPSSMIEAIKTAAKLELTVKG